MIKSQPEEWKADYYDEETGRVLTVYFTAEPLTVHAIFEGHYLITAAEFKRVAYVDPLAWLKRGPGRAFKF